MLHNCKLCGILIPNNRKSLSILCHQGGCSTTLYVVLPCIARPQSSQVTATLNWGNPNIVPTGWWEFECRAVTQRYDVIRENKLSLSLTKSTLGREATQSREVISLIVIASDYSYVQRTRNRSDFTESRNPFVHYLTPRPRHQLGLVAGQVPQG